MPNWCFTQMIFHGEKEEITDFHNKIEEWTSKNYQENGFGVNWLGNILYGAGLGDRLKADAKPSVLRCRGDITFIGDIDTFKDSTEATFNLDTETAWCPMTLMWSEVIKTIGYKSIGFSYMAEEPGCEIYEIYDPYGGDFDDKYYIDIFVDGDDEQDERFTQFYDQRYYADDDDLRDALQDLLKTDEQDLKTLIERAQKYEFKSEDSYLYVHEYNFVDSPS